MREAVVAASNKPDHAFKWLSKVWDKDTKIDDLRDTEGFPTLDAKVLSATTNALEGEFARQIDSFREREAHAGRLVRGRQVLAKLDAHFATSALHGSPYEFEDLLGVKFINENLIRFMSNWDTVLSGMKVAPDDKFLEPLFHRQIKKCKSISHDIAIYERATEGAKERSYAYLYQAASNYLARRRLDRNRERMARQLGDDKPALPAAKRVPKGFCISFVKNGSCKVDNCKYKHQIPDGWKDRSQSKTSSPDGSWGISKLALRRDQSTYSPPMVPAPLKSNALLRFPQSHPKQSPTSFQKLPQYYLLANVVWTKAMTLYGVLLNDLTFSKMAVRKSTWMSRTTSLT